MSGTQFLPSTTPTNALEVRGMTYGEPFPITLARKIRHAPENSRVKTGENTSRESGGSPCQKGL
jgi:hypothetical protein